jgi:PRTRC genetic system protein C
VARIFVYEGREFPDPDPSADVEEIKKRMGDFFPELANAEVKEVARGEDTLYEFIKKVGVKG